MTGPRTVTVSGPLTDYILPPIPTAFCGTVAFPLGNFSSSRCFGTNPCITIALTGTVTIAGVKTESALVTVWKQPPVFVADPTPPPSFEPPPAMEPQPARTASVSENPSPGSDTLPASTAQPVHSPGLGEIIASMFGNPFPPPKPSIPSSVGRSTLAGVPNPGAGRDHSGSDNTAPTSVPATYKHVLVSIAASNVVIGGTTFPANAAPTTLAVDGETISINPSQIIAPGITLNIPPPPAAVTALNSYVRSFALDVKSNNIVISGHTFTAGSLPTSTVINGQIFAVNPTQDTRPQPVVTTPPSTATMVVPTSLTIANVPITVGADNVVLNGQTFPAGSSPTSTVINGQTFTINPSQIIAPGTTINRPLAPITGTLSAYPTEGLKFSIAPDIAVVSGTTYSIGKDASPVTQVIGGQTVSFGPGGVGFASATVPLPEGPSISPTILTAGDLTISVESTAAVISGTTYGIGSGAMPMTKTIGSQTVSFGPGGVGFATATIPPPDGPSFSPTIFTAGDLAISVGSTAAVISGTTYRIGSGAMPTTKMIGSQTVSFGPGGVGLARTTVPPPGEPLSSPMIFTAANPAISVASTAAIISGTTYSIGSGVMPTTKVIGGQTVSFGPNGVGLASKTLAEPTASNTGAALPSVDFFIGGANNLGLEGAAAGTILAFGLGLLFVL